MSGGKDLYESFLKEHQMRVIAMQVFAGGVVSAREAIEYVCSFPNIESILFGASSKANIQETVNLIRQFDQKNNQR